MPLVGRDEIIDLLRGYVASTVSAEVFASELFASNDAFQQVLDIDPHLPPGNYVGSSVFLYLMSRDLSDPFDQEDARSAISDFLGRNGLGEIVSHQTEIQCALDAQPRWLDVIPSEFFTNVIWAHRGDRQGQALKEWIAEQLLKHFKFEANPPKWLQSPEWPIVDHSPLTFIGQLEVKSSEEYIYVFRNDRTNAYTCISQRT
jgi:hypothetical protein